MNMTKSAADARIASDASVHPALADDPRQASRPPLSGVTAKRPASSTHPFASLKHEKTVEAKVSPVVLEMAKGQPMGSITSVYQVPHELLEMARRDAGSEAGELLPPGSARAARGARHAAPPRGWLAAARVRDAVVAAAPRVGRNVGKWLRAGQTLELRSSPALRREILQWSLAAAAWGALLYWSYCLIVG